MSANILDLDSAARPSWAPQSWHKLENVVEGDITQKEQIPDIACSIHLEPFPLPPGYIQGSSKCSHVIVAEHRGEKVVINSASRQYHVFGNDQVFDLVMDALSQHGIEAKLSFALTMGNKSRINYCFELPEASEFFKGDKHTVYANFYNCHDKSDGFHGFGSATRGVCQNTVNLALNGIKEGFDFTFWHDKRGLELLKKLPELMLAVHKQAKAYSVLAQQLGNKAINQTEAEAIIIEILARDNGGRVTTNLKNAKDEILRLYKKGQGNTGDSLWDVLNGFTEYYTSGDGTGRKVDAFKKMVRSDFGDGADMKVNVVQTLQADDGEIISDADLNAIIANGEKLLLEYA
jgi:hypothetical protein